MTGAPSAFGIRPEQGPKLGIPLRFFLTAPLALIAAGALLLGHGGLFVSRAHPATIGATHLGTLGFLGAIMLGALYQMLPVVAGAPVPCPRLSAAVHAGLVLGLVALLVGFLGGPASAFTLAWLCLGATFAGFLGPAAFALARAPVRSATTGGMALALSGLTAVVVLGALLARTRAGAPYAENWIVLLGAHMALGGLVWLGGLITAVSWRVVPMFYLTAEPPKWSERAILAGVALTLAGAVTVAATGVGSFWLGLAAVPGAAVVWLLHPVITLRALRRRKRRRTEESVLFWNAGLATAPLAAALALASAWLSDPRWAVGLGWTALFGWAGLIAHGMLTRIVPFLVWFHRYAPLAGLEPVPAMRQLIPPRHVRLGLGAHVATLAIGWVAIATRSSVLTRLTGLGLALTGALLFAGLLRASLHLRGRSAAG